MIYNSSLFFHVKFDQNLVHFFLYSSYPMNDAAGTINEIGATIRRVMGGTSGILYDNLCFRCSIFPSLISCLITME